MIYSNNRFKSIAKYAKGKVLDIGSNEDMQLEVGLHSYLKNLSLDVTGMDLDEADVVHNADEFPYPFKKESFDSIVAGEIIEHLKRPFDFLCECRRILKKGGLLILTTPNARMLMLSDDIKDDKYQYQRYRYAWALGYKYHKYAWTLGTFIGLIKSAGFKIVDYGYVNIYQHNLMLKFLCELNHKQAWHLIAVAKKEVNKK